MGNTVISNISRFEIDTTAFSPFMSYIGMKWMVFRLYWRHVTLTHYKRTSLARTHHHWNTQHCVGESPRSLETQSLEHMRVPHFHPTHISVGLENAHKILLDFNFSLSWGHRIFQTLRQLVQSDKRIIKTHPVDLNGQTWPFLIPSYKSLCMG